MSEMFRNREWPIISFSLFTLGVFAANDFGHEFARVVGLSFMAVAFVWTIASQNRRRCERADVRVQSLAA